MPLLTTTHIKQIAAKIMADLGAGYSEVCYQTALFNRLIKIDPSTQKEKTAQVVYEGEVIGTCRADIVTSEHIIEVKATNSMPPKVIKQIRKYMVNFLASDMVSRNGIVINFNQDTEQAEFVTLDPVTLEVSAAECKQTRRSAPKLGQPVQQDTLTEEQLEQIARNRAAALARRALCPSQ